MVLDGEVVIENEKGISDFQLLREYSKTRKGKLKFFVFDILYFENYVLTNMPLLQRKELLSAFLRNIHSPMFLKRHSRVKMVQQPIKNMFQKRF